MGAGVKYISQMKNLKYISLSDTALKSGDLKFAQHLKKLKYLHLRDTQVGDEGMVFLKKLKRLEEMDLSGTAITDKGVKQISENLSSLRDINIATMKITDKSAGGTGKM